MTFTYTGHDRWGAEISGSIAAASEEEARYHLSEQAIQVESIAVPWHAREFGKPTVKKGDLSVFTSLFASLLRSNLKPREALEELRAEAPGKTLRKVLVQVSTRVEGGRPLAEAMAEHPSVFDNVYTSAVRAGEASGSLKDVLSKLAVGLERTEKTRRKVVGSLTYPVIVLSIVSIVGAALLYFIVPQIAGQLLQAGAELPVLTKILLGASDATQKFGPVVLVLLIVAAVSYKLGRAKSPSFREKTDYLMTRIPIIGEIVLFGSTARFAHLFAILLAGRAGIVESLTLAAATVPNTHIRNRFLQVTEGHAEGRPLWEEMKRVGTIPAIMVTMVKVGERSATLAEQMEVAGHHYDEQVEFKMEKLTSVLGPITIVLAFIPVIMLVIGIYVPMIQAVQSLG